MKELKLPTLAGIITLLFLATMSFVNVSFSRGEYEVLKVSFLDVGQGDAIFIESPSGTQVLIDGGVNSRILGALADTMGFFDRDIDMIIATHPDQDHIGGLIDVLKQYEIKTIVMTENINDTPVYEAFIKAVQNERVQIIFARTGQIFDLGDGESGSTTLTMLFPDLDPTSLESNLSSIVARLVYGESEYLFTGDSPIDIEEYLVGRDGSLLQSDVLKVGHHGSRTSTSEIFLKAVAPSYAIISAGKDNSYGHPHKEVTELLTRYAITQKNTATEGSIFSETDGVSLWFK